MRDSGRSRTEDRTEPCWLCGGRLVLDANGCTEHAEPDAWCDDNPRYRARRGPSELIPLNMVRLDALLRIRLLQSAQWRRLQFDHGRRIRIAVASPAYLARFWVQWVRFENGKFVGHAVACDSLVSAADFAAALITHCERKS